MTRCLSDWQKGPAACADDVLMDGVFQPLSKAPSMRAMLDYFPDAANVGYEFGDTDDPKLFAQCFVECTKVFRHAARPLFESCNLSVFGHEIRHNWHRYLDILSDLYSFSVFGHMALRRAFEIDSRVFSMSVVAEIVQLTGDQSVVQNVLDLDFDMNVEAIFFDMCGKHPESLWDGRAQAAAYRTFLKSIMRIHFYLTMLILWII